MATAQEIQEIPDTPPQRTVGPSLRGITSSWDFDLRTTYTDNFRRIDNEQTRFFFQEGVGGALEPIGVTSLFLDPDTNEIVIDEETGLPVTVFTRSRETLDVETPDNIVFAASLQGGTVYNRPGIVAIARGRVSVNAYADDASIDERLAEVLATPAGEGVLPAGVTQEDVVLSSFGRTRQEIVRIRPDISASATTRVVDELFYVDVAGVAQQQVINQRQALIQEADGQIGDTTTFVGASVSPYVTRRVVDQGTVEARLRFSGVFVADEEFDPSTEIALGESILDDDENRRFANDSFAQEALLSYQSGQLLDRLKFGVTTSVGRSDESGSDVLDEVELVRVTGTVDGEYAFSQTVALLATLGYDDVSIDEQRPSGFDEEGDPIDSDVREEDFSGVYWSLGAAARPNSRSRVALSIGERFGGTQIVGELSYQPSPRLSISAIADRELGTGTQQAFRGAGNLNSQTLRIVQQLAAIEAGSSNNLVDRTLGFQSGFANVEQQNFGLGVLDTFQLRGNYTARRTDFGLSAFVSRNEFGRGDNTRTNERYAVQASVRRQVTRRVSVGTNARLERIEGVLPVEAVLAVDSTDQTSDQIFVSVDGAYQVGRRLSLTARAYHNQSDGGGRAFGIAREYEENAVSAGVRWTF